VLVSNVTFLGDAVSHPARMSNENEDYAYFRKLVKLTSVILCLKLSRVLKFTLAGKCKLHTLTTLSAKKPVVSTVVAV